MKYRFGDVQGIIPAVVSPIGEDWRLLEKQSIY
jgi:hypothetical protein